MKNINFINGNYSDNNDGGALSITIGNVTNTTEVVNGIASFVIPNLDAGTYDAVITYVGGENYTDVSKDAQFSVVKQNAEIIASAKSYVINYGGKYSVTVKGVAGEKVTFTLNGKNIGSAITDANGVATISLTAKILKAAKAGKKNLVINLDSTNYQANKTVKLTINKEKTKVTAKKKTFKRAKKVKKYTITLKNSKGKAVKKVKVTLKIKGKTFKAKTNSKGKATFKIKKITKKGTFKSTIKFKGNAYYKPVTKKVKIKLK